MTLHSAKGLEFDTVFLPGWEEGLFPHQRSLDESGRAGLEEERRLAHVGITRARKRAKLYFASNRRIHGLWSTTIPSRFLDELPEAHVEVTEAKAGGTGWRRQRAATAPRASTTLESFGSTYSTPGWQRAQKRSRGGRGGGGLEAALRRLQRQCQSIRQRRTRAHHRRRARRQIDRHESAFLRGDRVFHEKFGYGQVT